MQTTTYQDGRVIREFFTETSGGGNAEQRAVRALADPNVRGVVTQRIARNGPCPCGSGRKFKKCCIDRLDAGPPTHRKR